VERLRIGAPELNSANIEKLAGLFPAAVTESAGPDGSLVRAINFDVLRQELSGHLVEGPQERYQLDWPGKRAALLAASTPLAKTLRPVREESAAFDRTGNLFIEGDNLEVLKLLQESYRGKVKLIYIDPPYNTGGKFIYNDDYAESSAAYLARSGQADGQGVRLVAGAEADGRFHSDWLSMMYPRLKLARNLLKDDGVIFISIDDNEIDSLRKLCAEVFGGQNFVAQIIWQKVYSPKNTALWFSQDHEYIVCFAKNKPLWRPRPLPRTAAMEARYKNPDNDPRGPWKPGDLAARNPYSAGTYPITTPSGRVIDGPPRGSYWRFNQARFEELDADGRIWWGSDGSNVPAIKRFLSEVADGRTPQTLWTYQEVGHTQDAKKTLLKYVPFEHTGNVLNSVKPVELVQRILHLATDPAGEDIVLDFFGGSGTTAHAVMKQNTEDGGRRRYVSVQVHEPLPVPEPAFDSILGMSLTRVRNVAAELSPPRDGEHRPDLGFRLLTVDTPGPAARPGEDLLFQVLLGWGLELSLPVGAEKVEGHEVFMAGRTELIACFDMDLSPGLVRAMAGREPRRAVYRDCGFASDEARKHAEQIFREVSPATDLRVI
jgi:adenine-specific DNA-methyltransferase